MGQKQCSRCYGSGYDTSCYICHGSGETDSSDGTYRTRCSSCGGTGKLRCSRCNGSGYEDDGSSGYSSSSSSGSSSGGGGGGRNRASAANDVIGKYNSAWKLYKEKKHREAADDFGYVVNSLRDPEWKEYVDEINSNTDAFQKDFKQLDEEFPSLCILAGLCYFNDASEKKEQGNLEEALQSIHTAIRYVSYSGKEQDILDSYTQVLATMYVKYGDICKQNGKTDRANEYYQRAVNIATPETLKYLDLEKKGINFKATVDTINNDAEARFKAENFGVAACLWKKTADMGDAIGQSNLGNLYFDGRGVPQDSSKCIDLLSKAAEQNDAYSLNYLGNIYRNGLGTNQNLTKAKKFYKRAAALGNADAKKSFKELDKRNGFVSFLFGLVCGGGGVLTLTWILVINFGEKWASLLTILGVLIVGIIFAVIAGSAWRDKKNIRFILMLLIGIIGWSSLFGLVPKSLKSIYANAQEAKTTTEQTATVTADSANFRSAPSTSGGIIKTLKKGDTLTVTGKVENGWVPVKHGDNTGYVSADLVSIPE